MVAVALVGCLQAVLVIGQARVLSTSISRVFHTRDASGVGGAALIVIGIFVIRGLLTWLNSWLAHRASAAVKSALRNDVMAARLAAPTSTTTPTGKLITLMTQGLDALDGYFGKYLPQLILAGLVPLIVGATIVAQDLASALIIIVTLPLIPLFMVLIGWTTRDRMRTRMGVQYRLANHFADLVAGLATLQVFGRARAQLEGLRRTEDANRNETMSTLRVSFMSAFALEMLATLSVALVAVSIGFRVVFGQLDLTTALYVLILAPEVYLPVRQVGVHYHDSVNGQVAAEAAFALIDNAAKDAPTGTVPAPGLAGADVRLTDVTYRYPGTAEPALAGFNATIRPGQVVALAGPSGGGKSTALALVLAFARPTTGTITVGGVDLATIDPASWRAQLAWVGQHPGMVRGSIADNIAMGHPGAGVDLLRSALDRVGGGDLPLDRTVGDDGEGLSAGERRRVAMARALLRIELGGARLLVLDEPTAGLDQDREASVLSAVRDSGAAALIVSHRPAVLELADHVIQVLPDRAHAEPQETAQVG